jgi:hypothetical protein
MASTVSQDFRIDGSVDLFLRREGAQSELRTIFELARSCFPALRGIEATLQEDPDEDGRARVLVCVRLPASYAEDQLQASMARYHEELITVVPLDRCHLFALVTDFNSE